MSRGQANPRSLAGGKLAESVDTWAAVPYIVGTTILLFLSRSEEPMKSRSMFAVLTLAAVFASSFTAQAFTVTENAGGGQTLDRPIHRHIPGSGPLPEKWKSFISRYDVNWSLRWDERRDLPHRALLSGLSLTTQLDEKGVLQSCRAFVDDNQALFGVESSELDVIRSTYKGKWYVIFQQTHRGLPVYGGRVHFRIADNGNLLMFGSECLPDVRVDITPAVAEEAAVSTAGRTVGYVPETDELADVELLIFPRETASGYAYSLAWSVRLRTDAPPGNWLVFVDAHTNEVIHSDNQIRFDDVYGTVTGFMLPEFYDETPVEAPYARETVTVPGTGSVNTDVSGYYTIAVGPAGTYPVQSMLSGPYVTVDNDDGPEALHSDSASTSAPHNWAWTAPGDGLPDEINMYYHVVHVHNWIKGPPYNYNGMDYQMVAEVRYGSNYDNAFYDGRDIHFGEGSNAPGGFRNLALFSDVIYHEYTHGIIDHIYSFGMGDEFGAMHEGFADYMACTQNDDPYIGDGGLVFDGGYLRSQQNNRRYPEDFIGQVHNDGLIIGGAMWDLRTYEGPTLTDSLWVFALYGEALTFEDYLTEVLIADDDNGNLGDGTPHACSIYLAFGKHGIGPGVATVDHTPLQDTEDTLNPYPVVATIIASMPLTETIWLYYSVEPDTVFTQVAMDSSGNPDEYEGFIPPQPGGSTVNYYISILCMTAPAGAPDDSVYTFYVGADTVSPSIDHTPLEDIPLAGWPTTVFAEVIDNMALESVTLEYRRNGLDETPLLMQRVGTTNTYAVDFASVSDTADLFSYRIIAVDSSAASNTTYEPFDESYHEFQVCIGFFDDMENGQGDWTHQYGSFGYVDEWHMSQSRNYNPLDQWSWKCGATGGGGYANRNHSLLITPEVDVASGSVLRFWHWMEAETLDDSQAWDGGLVEVSTDGGTNWSQIAPVDGYKFTIVDNPVSPYPGGTPCFSGRFDWRQEEFDLSAFTGLLRFRFNFGTDGYVVREGWYIDDVSVYYCTEPGIDEFVQRARIPVVYGMSDPYPNPFSHSASIRLQLPARSHVELRIYNTAGQVINTLLDGPVDAGYMLMEWDGTDARQRAVPNGIYFFDLKCSRQGQNAFARTSKTILLKK